MEAQLALVGFANLADFEYAIQKGTVRFEVVMPWAEKDRACIIARQAEAPK